MTEKCQHCGGTGVVERPIKREGFEVNAMELVRLAEKANLKPLEFLRSAVVLEKEGQLPQVSHWFCPCPIGQRKQRDREDRARIRRESSDDLH